MIKSKRHLKYLPYELYLTDTDRVDTRNWIVTR